MKIYEVIFQDIYSDTQIWMKVGSKSLAGAKITAQDDLEEIVKDVEDFNLIEIKENKFRRVL